MGTMLRWHNLTAVMLRVATIVFCGRARRGLLLTTVFVFEVMAIRANAQIGFRDDIANPPGSFVFASSPSSLPIPYYGNSQSDTGTRINFIDANGVIRSVQMNDYDDLYQFRVYYDSARADDSVGSGAVQVLNIVWLGDSGPAVGKKKSQYKLPQPAEPLRVRDWQNSGLDGGTLESRTAADDAAVLIADEASLSIDEPEESNAFGLAYGLGTLGTEQQARIQVSGSIIGDSYWASDVENLVLGPKAGFVWRNRRGPWSFDLQSSILLGFNSGQVNESSQTGGSSIPGAINRLIYMRPTYSSHTDERQLFTPVGELRAQSRFRLTDALSLRTTWSSIVAGNLLNQSGEVHFALPRTTFVVENDNMLIHQVYCGLEYVH